MVPWKIIVGIALFALSSFIAAILSWGGITLTFQGEDYATEIMRKICDVFAGSLILWGVLGKNPAKGTKK